MSEKTWTEFRIMSKPPRNRRWTYSYGSRSQLKSRDPEHRAEDLATITRWLELHREQSPGWQFKIQTRTVTRRDSEWKDQK